jgi:multidrug efflux pump subunit AcrB
MWIVRLALRRSYTFIVVSILILIMGMLAIVRAPTDIFPNIDIPVISIIRNYNSLVPEDMSDNRSWVNRSPPRALPVRP